MFEIDHDSFATVLEYCQGTDLDRRLKEEGMLPERKARAIMWQVLKALRHMNGCDGSPTVSVHFSPPLLHGRWYRKWVWW